MQRDTTKIEWNEYCRTELPIIVPILLRLGFTLDSVQPHLKGERFLMNAITTTSGRKLILLGENTAKERVVIKASKEKNGIRELNHERRCRNILTRMDFARDVFHTPREIAYTHVGSYCVSVQEFIDQPCSFLELPLESQFTFALSAFKGQEGAHATTYKHRALIEDTFGIRTALTYLDTFKTFTSNIGDTLPNETSLLKNLERTYHTLVEHTTIIEQYCGFLTHTDFVPHNFRIRDNTMYLLDHSSLTFGNKYEGWARFLNFMTLYNPQLERAFVTYVSNNRTQEESVSLSAMRMYRLGEIIWYYARTLEKSGGDLFTLNTARIYFWNDVLTALYEGKEVSDDIRNEYVQKRDSLRSEDEKQRQQGLH